MAELTLRKADQPQKGKTWPKPEGATRLREFHVYRYDPDSPENPRVDRYEIDTSDISMILDALIRIKDTLDPTLTFRRSCREGVCGSCAMNINGANTLACTKGMDECGSGDVAIYPLPHQPVVKDLVTDLTNRRFGPAAARVVVVAGFVLAVALSIWLASPRIAIASGSAFLVAQLLDVAVFEKLRRQAWWKAPLISSLMGSVIDTVLFFGVAFSAGFAFLDTGFGLEDGSLAFPVPFLGVGSEVPLWMSLAAGDFTVKILVALVLLAPYRVLRGLIADKSAVPA